MKKIEKIKFWFGIILLSFALIGGLIFYLESFEIFDRFLTSSSHHLSAIWRQGQSGASNTPNFLGFCAIAGAILLVSVKEEKNS